MTWTSTFASNFRPPTLLMTTRLVIFGDGRRNCHDISFTMHQRKWDSSIDIHLTPIIFFTFFVVWSSLQTRHVFEVANFGRKWFETKRNKRCEGAGEESKHDKNHHHFASRKSHRMAISFGESLSVIPSMGDEPLVRKKGSQPCLAWPTISGIFNLLIVFSFPWHLIHTRIWANDQTKGQWVSQEVS